MKFEDFYQFVDKTINELIETAEIYRNTKIDYDDIEFGWGELPKVKGREAVILEIMDKIYVDENKIYPCADLYFKGVKNGILTITGFRANYELRPFGIGWSGRKGPFIYGAGTPTENEMERFKIIEKLKERGLLP
jgi:hypothetical protein